MTAYRVVNADFTTGGDKVLLAEAAAGVDVLAIVEARDGDNQPIDVQAVLGDEWTVYQDTSTAATAGCALAIHNNYKVNLLHAHLVEMSPATTKGGGVQTRYLLKARIKDGRRKTRVLVAHLPVPATGLQDTALAVVVRAIRWLRLGRRRWIILGDVNCPPDYFAAKIGAAHHHGDKPMAVAWSAGWGDVETGKTRLPGSDHAVLTVRAKS